MGIARSATTQPMAIPKIIRFGSVGTGWKVPSRERAFLDNLLGPNGEMISYERIGSHDYGDTILDVYQITYSGLSTLITLYIDEYSWGTLFAPVGFTCSGAFSITGP